MTTEEFSEVLNLCGAKDVEGWSMIPEGRHLTLHLASGGVGLTIGRIIKVRQSAVQLQVHTAKEETYVVSVKDVFACAFEDSEKRTARRAGFA